MTSTEELACVYSALIIQDGSSPVTAARLQTLLKSAGVQVEPYWPGLFAKALETVNLRDLVSNVGSGGGSATGTQAGGAASAIVVDKEGATKEDKKEEEEEEDEDDMGFGLFD